VWKVIDFRRQKALAQLRRQQHISYVLAVLNEMMCRGGESPPTASRMSSTLLACDLPRARLKVHGPVVDQVIDGSGLQSKSRASGWLLLGVGSS
jgi:hypothetical protein